MLFIYALDGASSSSSKTDLDDVVRKCIPQNMPYYMVYDRAILWNKRVIKKGLETIDYWEDSNNDLLCIGKSLGAKYIITKVLNKLARNDYPLVYKRVFCITIDPCWPTWKDLTPNLNHKTLLLEYPVNDYLNLYVKGSKRQQCGARVTSKYHTKDSYFYSHNVAYPFLDHFSITGSYAVRSALTEFLRVL